MGSIQVRRFGGIRPSLTGRALSADNAQVAHNTELRDTSLRPFNAPRLQRTDPHTIRAVHLPPDTEECCTSPLTWDHCVSVSHPVMPGFCAAFTWVLVWHHHCDFTYAERLNPCTGETAPLVVPGPTKPPVISLAYVDTARNNNRTGTGWNQPTDIYNANAAQAQNPLAVDIYKGPDERSYTYTWVDKFGVESRPAPPSRPLRAHDTDHVAVTGFEAPPPNAVCMRLYRTSANLDSGDQTKQPHETSFQLVDELPVPVPATYTDTTRLRDIAWGTLLTADHCDPPACMEQVLETESGYTVGFRGNTIYLSEKNEPWNFPEYGRIELPDRIVGIVNNHDIVFVATTGRPFRMNVAFVRQGDRADVTADPVQYVEPLPCLQKETLVRTNMGAAYITHRGVVFLESTGPAKLVSRPRMDEDEWLAYAPNIAAWHGGRYFGVRSPVGRGIIMDFRDTSEGQLDLGDIVTVDCDADVLHAGRDGRLWFAKGNRLFTWDEDHKRMTYRWRSKVFTHPQRTGWGAAKIVADYGQPVTFRLYASHRLVYVRTVDSVEPFRLPAFGKHLTLEFEVEGAARVHEVHIGTSVWDLTREGADAR